MRGRTTQKRVSSTRKLSAEARAISAVTTTAFKSSESCTERTVPMSTALCLMRVLLASMPSPDLNWMVIVGPLSHTALNASQPPTSAAATGTIQTSCSERGAALRSIACGTSSSSVAMRLLDRVPGEARIEARRGEHREDHHRGEEDRAGAGHDGGERLELH